MKDLLKRSLFVLGLALWLGGSLFVTTTLQGCRDLDPSGVYAGDKLLYRADLTITSSKSFMDAFVTFEFHNRALLQLKHPEVKAAADTVRTQGKASLQSAVAARDAYAAASTAANATALNTALATLTEAASQAQAQLLAATQTK